jgi:anti-sigma factor RsiW
MKAELLEALLIDRALGALSPEVGELLETHLARDPAAAEQAAGLSATVGLARRAMARPEVQPMRSLPLAQWRKQAIVQRRHARAWELTRLAAGLLLGLSLGWYGRTGGDGTGLAEHPRPAEPARLAAVADQSGPVEPAKSFWALSGFTAGPKARPAAAESMNTRYRLRWDSPVKIPQVEGNL